MPHISDREQRPPVVWNTTDVEVAQCALSYRRAVAKCNGLTSSTDGFRRLFEAYIGGAWYTFDARNNTPRIGRVVIARGRDAADVAISMTFGPNVLEGFASGQMK